MTARIFARLAALVLTTVILTVPAGADTLKEMAEKVTSAIRASRQMEAGSEHPLIFGHFVVVEKRDDGPRGSVSAPVTAVKQETQPPEFTCNGTMKMRDEMVVFIRGASYRVGSNVDGYRITEITATDVKVEMDGKSFTMSAR